MSFFYTLLSASSKETQIETCIGGRAMKGETNKKYIHLEIVLEDRDKTEYSERITLFLLQEERQKRYKVWVGDSSWLPYIFLCIYLCDVTKVKESSKKKNCPRKFSATSSRNIRDGKKYIK